MLDAIEMLQTIRRDLKERAGADKHANMVIRNIILHLRGEPRSTYPVVSGKPEEGTCGSVDYLHRAAAYYKKHGLLRSQPALIPFADATPVAKYKKVVKAAA